MKKSNKWYYESAYKGEFVAKVLEVVEEKDCWRVVLDGTCFYPVGGGQPADTGVLGGVRVVDCYLADGIVYHIMEGKPNFGAGDEVAGAVDFARRYAFMQNHSGEHLLSGLAKSRYGATNVGFHMSEAGFTMDLDLPLDVDVLNELEVAANAVINEGVVFEISWLAGDGLGGLDARAKRDFAADDDVRLVDVPGYDLCACAGLHVANAYEIGILKIVSHQKYKGGVRLTVFCGADAWRDYSRKNEIVKEVSRLLSAEIEGCGAGIERLLGANAALKEEIAGWKNRIFELRAQEVAPGADLAYFFEEGLTMEDLRRFAALTAERAKIAVVLSSGGEGHKYAICGCDEIVLTDFAKRFNAALNGRGGGKGVVAQGAVQADFAMIEAYLEGLL